MNGQQETYFNTFRKNIIGIDQEFSTPFGKKKIIYADWIASGRLYRPIEQKLADDFGPYVGNTHSESSVTGTTMTKAYHDAREIIKKHVNAGEEDLIITAGFGMTTVINKFHRILGLRVPDVLLPYTQLPDDYRPVIFITHMEHHSNQTSWLESFADVHIIEPNDQGLVDLNHLEYLLKKCRNYRWKIGAFTACSNVTGIETDYHAMAKIMHQHGGVCFVDFAASAPYCNINMHPEDPMEKLDAIFFSPHKFLGGPGTSGVLIFHSSLYLLKVPDRPGGGTVDWTNPWGEHKYVNDIEAREDGGTPGFLQAIKAALCVKLKDKMGCDNIYVREKELLAPALRGLRSIPGVHILANEVEERLGIISFYVEDIHYNLLVKLLNDKFGVQVRGGCSCAGTYGHYLLHVDPTRSQMITDKINRGDLSEKPGWVRLSLHPTMTNQELQYTLEAIRESVIHAKKWAIQYRYCSRTNEFFHQEGEKHDYSNHWFEV